MSTALQRVRLYGLLTVTVICLFAFLPIDMAAAHGGGLNAQGCHNDRKRGGYHCHRGPTVRAPSPRPARLSTPQAYPNCDTARAAGRAPIYRGQQGYGTHLDRDGDGIGCEGSASSGAGYQTPVRAAGPAAIAAVPSPSASAASALPVPLEGRAQVLDGDTIQIGLTRIRLFGIDAFESEQMCVEADGSKYGCGGKATRALLERIDNEPVTCSPRGSDAFGRQLAVCRAAATDLGAWMVRHGHALAYSKYALDYVADERHARAGVEGAWSGSFDLPWEYRLTRPSGAAEAQRSATAPSANCVIKGNVSKKGERLYHLPSDPAYSRIKAENWFCGVIEAEKAGFQRAGA